MNIVLELMSQYFTIKRRWIGFTKVWFVLTL